jgi:hydroxyacylglutathione hydrolase
VFPPAAAAGNEQVPQVSADELKQRLPSNDLVVVDVRNDNEWKEGHIAEAIHIPLGQLAQRVNELPASDNIVVHCQGGTRSSIAASLLQKLGRKNVTNLTGGYRRWLEVQSPKLKT